MNILTNNTHKIHWTTQWEELQCMKNQVTEATSPLELDAICINPESLYIELKKSSNFKVIFYSMHPSVHVSAK